MTTSSLSCTVESELDTERQPVVAGSADPTEPPVNLGRVMLRSGVDGLFAITSEAAARYDATNRRWTKVADPPNLQRFDAIAVGDSLVIVGGECRTDDPPCRAFTSTFAVLNPPYERWDGGKRGGAVSAETFGALGIGSSADEAFFGVGTDLWAIRRDGRLTVTRAPEPFAASCLSRGRVLLVTYEHDVLRLRRGEWETAAEAPDPSLTAAGGPWLPACIGGGVVLVADDGKSLYLDDRTPRWTPIPGIVPPPYEWRKLDGFGGRFAAAGGGLHRFSESEGWTPVPTPIDWSRPITGAELDGQIFVAGDGLVTLLDVPPGAP